MYFKSLPQFIFLVLAMLWGGNALAQTADVRGFVYDKASGEPIIFTNVQLENTKYGASTDINGLYSISQVPPGNYNLICTYVGYDTTRVAISLKAGQVLNQLIYISESNIVLKGVEITAEKEEARTEVQISTVKITAKQLSQVPTIGGEPDLAQYLQILPGVVSTGDQGGQLYIRGGSPIQTKVLLDGMTIYNPFHSVGLFSVFETDVIRNVDVITGGFNAEYGGRIGAIVDITSRDGNKREIEGKASINTFGAKALLEGPIVKMPEDGNGLSISYLVTGKTSFLDRSSKVLYDYVDTLGLPYSFTDIYGKISLGTANGSRINFSGFRFDDKAFYNGTSDFRWNSWGINTNFVLIPGQAKTIIDGHFSYSDYKLSLQESDARPRSSSIGGFNGGINFSYFFPKSTVKYGIELSGFSTTLNFVAPPPLSYQLNYDQFTTEIAGFLKYKTQLLGDKLLLEPSLRLSYYASVPAFGVEPRFGLKYNITDRLRYKLAGGVYTQNFISVKSDRDVVNLFNAYLSAPDGALLGIDGQPINQNIQRAYDGVTGFEIDLARHFSLNIETYYKNFTQLIGLNRNKLFATDPDFVTETGKAYGAELLLKYENKRWFMWAVYSLGFVTRNDGNQVYHPHFDRRHNINLVSSYRFGRRLDWELSARWNIGSGFPFTQTQGFYEQVNLGSIGSDYTHQNGSLGVLLSEDLDGGRLPYYHRLDLGIKKEFMIGANAKIEANAGVTNAYNRKNIFFVNRTNTKDIVYQLPVIPTIGLSVSF